MPQVIKRFSSSAYSIAILLPVISLKYPQSLLGRVGKPRQRALTAILPPELHQKKLDVA